MKSLCILAIAGLFTSLNAQASYFATFCSNANGSVRWESGHTSNTIQLRYYNDGEQKISFSLGQVRIKFLKEVTLDEKEVRRCGFHSKTRIYAGPVVITDSSEHPGTIRDVLDEDQIETTVICNFHINGRAPCPELQ